MSKKCIQIWLEVQIYFQKKSLALNRLELRDGCYLGKIFNLWCSQTKIYLFLRTMQHTPYHRARNSLQTFDHNCYTCHLWYVHACQSWVWSGFHVTMSSNPIWIRNGIIYKMFVLICCCMAGFKTKHKAAVSEKIWNSLGLSLRLNAELCIHFYWLKPIEASKSQK